MSRRSEKAAATLQQLEEAATQAIPLQAIVKDKTALQKLSRTEHALTRRIDVWQQVRQVEAPGQARAGLPTMDPQAVAECLAAIDAMLRDRPERSAWESFLELDKLRAWLAHRGGPKDRVPRALAAEILKRLDAPVMSARQRRFVSTGPIGALRQELLRHTAETVDTAALLRQLERYERTGLAADARLLARDCRWLALSPAEKSRQLGDAIDAHYRNANVRVAISGELLNRLIPKRDPEYASVDDTLLGLPVHGQSLTSTTVRVLLVPDPNRALVALQVTGHVSSLTSATSGPATFINDSNSMYAAAKSIEVNLQGIRLGPTQVDVYNKTTLRNVKTDFDGIPLVGQLAKGVARSQREQKEPATHPRSEGEGCGQGPGADRRRDHGSPRAIGRPVGGEGFRPVGGARAGPGDDCGADHRAARDHADSPGGRRTSWAATRRAPRRPADSLASFQVHESVINNVVQRLGLDGRTFTLPELSRHLARCLSRPQPADDPDHDDVSITFAAKDAVRVRFAEGRDRVDRLDRQARQGRAAMEEFPGPRVLSSRAGGPHRGAGSRRRH